MSLSGTKGRFPQRWTDSFFQSWLIRFYQADGFERDSAVEEEEEEEDEHCSMTVSPVPLSKQSSTKTAHPRGAGRYFLR